MIGSDSMVSHNPALGLKGFGNGSTIRINTPAKPMSTSVDTLKSAGFLLPGERHAAV